MKKTLLLGLALFLALFLTVFTSLYAQDPDVQYSPVIPNTAGLTAPVEIATAPGQPADRLYIVEQRGTIRIWDNGALRPGFFLDIQSIVNFDGNERGLLSMAFHPQYATNGLFYVYYNNNAGNVTVSQFQVSADPFTANPSPNPATPLITVIKPFTNHNGGHLQFKVEGSTNYLYFATGDGGSSDDPNRYSQNYTSFLGKMIRIDVDAATPTPQIWAWGLRNPFRWSFDRATGDMWIGDVGQNAREELNFRAGGTIGANYGWPCFEGSIANAAGNSGSRCDTVDNVDVIPVYDYLNPTLGRSIVGGYVYRGTQYPAMQGYYFFTDFFSDRLWMVRPDGGGGWTVTSKTGFATNISSISEGTDGSLYAVSLTSGTVYKLVVPVVTPLKLTGFSGRGYGTYNELNWTTESEEGMDKYIVEYSEDGRNFAAITEVAARNNISRNSYSYRHTFTQPTGRTMYYRLRMEELNGVFAYSAVVPIGDGKYTGLKVYPTVIQQGSLNGSINVISGIPIEAVTVTGVDGRVILTKQMNGVDGYFNVALPSMQKGFYMVQFMANGFKQTEKILVQ